MTITDVFYRKYQLIFRPALRRDQRMRTTVKKRSQVRWSNVLEPALANFVSEVYTMKKFKRHHNRTIDK